MTSPDKRYIAGNEHDKGEPCMKLALCDDSPAFLKQLQKAIVDICVANDRLCSCVCYSSTHELLAADLSSIQVLFLDVDMPGMNGLEAARYLRKTYGDLILVFVSGFVEYAPAGYDVAAFRYLLKSELGKKLSQCMKDVWEKLNSSRDTVRFRLPDHDARIHICDILYMEGTPRRHTLVYTTDAPDNALECKGLLSEYEAQLSDRGFLRIQRSYLVNMAHIEDIRNYDVILDNGKTLRVSRASYGTVCEQFVLWEGEHL